MNTQDDEDDVVNQPTADPVLPPATEPEKPVAPTTEKDATDEDVLDDVVDDTLSPPADVAEEQLNFDPDSINFDMTTVELSGITLEEAGALMNQAFREQGGPALDDAVKTVGSWENILYRKFSQTSNEENRLQQMLKALSDSGEELNSHSSILRDPETNKIRLRTTSIVRRPSGGKVEKVTGNGALMAFNCVDSGGAYRLPLYNSGLGIDIMRPTGAQIETLINNCQHMDRELGSSMGAYYFTYSDALIKAQFLRFLSPLIQGSSFSGWQKRETLWSMIKLPDLYSITATIAAMCHPDGYNDFEVACKRPVTAEHPHLCRHTEKLNIDVFKMILTRFVTMSEDAVNHMVATRATVSPRHSVQNIADYQKQLGYDGQEITIGDITFKMRVPSVMDYTNAGERFLAEIVNEIQADNTQGREEAIGLRYIRTFAPWIENVTRNADGGGICSEDYDVIISALEQVDRDPQFKAQAKFEEYVGKVQMTYVGHPSIPCNACGYVEETPSGLLTFDPFSAFFTLASVYSNPSASTATATA